ncbi:DUF1624 domain-containing protein [Brucella suis bv. 1]|nr:DUF1624 domain-containing protein [Brucella suis bv. 1]
MNRSWSRSAPFGIVTISFGQTLNHAGHNRNGNHAFAAPTSWADRRARGIALIAMAIYHFGWDLEFLAIWHRRRQHRADGSSLRAA